MDNNILSLDAFIRAIGIDKTAKYSIFLGAGASITSGIPSADNCIWEWKRNIFLTNNPGIEQHFSELSLPSVRERIQKWLDSQIGFPPNGAFNEYSFYVEKCYPISEHRRLYFSEKIKSASPYIGYKIICSLAEKNFITSVWTTNFDRLTPKAAAEFDLIPIEIGIDNQNRIERQKREGELYCISLHGDYRYDQLKNLDKEIADQEKMLTNALAKNLNETGIIVLGYSGRDKSIMSIFEQQFSQPGSTPIYWCNYGNQINESVKKLISTANNVGRTAYIIPTQGFDDTMIRLAHHILNDDEKIKIQKYLIEARNNNRIQNKSFEIPRTLPTALIKSNTFQVELPSEVFTFELQKWPEKPWEWLDTITKNKKIVAVPLRTNILALGILDEIHDTFSPYIKGNIVRTPITKKDRKLDHGAMNSLMRRALVKTWSEKENINGNGKSILWEKKYYSKKFVKGFECFINKAVIINLREFSNNMHLILKPTIMVFDNKGQIVPSEIEKIAKMEILGYEHNNKFNQALELWRNFLFPKKGNFLVEYPPNSGSTFKFKIHSSPKFAQIGSTKRNKAIKVDNRYTHLIKFKGIEINEPNLIFSSRQGDRITKDTHPLRGLKNNQPFDYSLTLKGFSQSVKLGVVCPQKEVAQIKNYLYESNQTHSPSDTEKDYLIEYSGFQQNFGIPLEIPSPGDNHWNICPELTNFQSIKDSTLQLADNIIRGIDSIVSAGKPNVIIVFIPKRWEQFKRYYDSKESFDLHDYVKSYCVQKGISTQFLEEKTIQSNQQCRIWWWLSIALYAKGIRTPWLLDGLDANTAFIGLGFTIDRYAPKGKHVVLGCSHLYNAYGEGLQFRLSKLEDPYFRGRNPHMSREDARRVSETIRRLFYESQSKLPNRVVIHKQTPFTKDEKEGLLEGLNGIDIIDLLKINIDSSLRFVSSKVTATGSFDEDNFPVRRGTTVKIDTHKALLWCHGVTDSVIQGWKYFQGKRHIPSPLLIERFSGSTDLPTLASEILGLSKMDWNSGDLYSKYPATINSSKIIARIGSKLQRFGEESYDYRLFM